MCFLNGENPSIITRAISYLTSLMPLNRSVFLDSGAIIFFGYQLLFLKKS